MIINIKSTIIFIGLLISSSCFAQQLLSKLNIPARYAHIDSSMFIYSQSNESKNGEKYHVCFLINPTDDTLFYRGRKRSDTFCRTKYLEDNEWKEDKILGYCYVGTKTYAIPPGNATAIRIYQQDLRAGTLKFGMEYYKKVNSGTKSRIVKWSRAIEIE